MIENALLDDPTPEEPRLSPLDAWHRARGARMVTFSGWSLPVQYDFNGALAERCRGGVMAEHLHCRTKAALFDVSHMGQAVLEGVTAPAALERLVPGDIAGLKPYRQRYTLLMNEAGGIIDDLMVANLGNDRLFLVVNAARRGGRSAASRGVAARLGPADRTRGSRPAGLAGTGSGLGHGGAQPEAAALPFMGVIDTALPVCRVGFTLRLHRGRRVRDLCPVRSASDSGETG